MTDILVRPYQVEGVARSLERNTLLRFEPGLGKTITAAAAVMDERPILFCIPKVARNVWLREFCRTGLTTIIELEGIKKLRAWKRRLEQGVVVQEDPLVDREAGGEGVYLVTHDCIAAWSDTVHLGKLNLRLNSAVPCPIQLPRHWAGVVIDESHRLGERNAKRTMGIRKLSAVSDRVVLLSGTPDLGGVQNLWSQLCLLDGRSWGTYFDFVLRYCGGEETKYGLRATRGTNCEELSSRVEPWVLSYRQSEVASYLPSNTRDRVVVPLTGEQAQKLGSLVSLAQKALAKLGTSRLDRTSWFLPGEVIEARLGCAMAKVQPVVEMAHELVSGLRERVVVWTWHKKPAQAVRDELHKLKVPCWVVSGDVSDRQLDAILARWGGPEGGVIIATIARLGEGEDRLVAATWQLFLELDWLPQRVQQAERRLLRLSQTRPVNTRFFQLDMPFERSFMDRVLQRAFDSDTLFGTSSAVDLGELFGVGPVMSDEEVLLRMSRRLG